MAAACIWTNADDCAPAKAEPDADLCAVHGSTLPAPQLLTAAVVRKIIFRLAAAILLLTFSRTRLPVAQSCAGHWTSVVPTI